MKVKFKPGLKYLAVLVDPDKASPGHLEILSQYANERMFDFFFVGGSLTTKSTSHVIDFLKLRTDLPVILFPGDLEQVAYNADAILFLSLVSGRNPEYLIGKHVLVAQKIKNSTLQVIPTGYILISSSQPTAVQYITQTQPIPRNKPQLAAATALAAELLGMQAVYLEAGSNAKEAVPLDVVSEVRKQIGIPLIVGGGIRTPNLMSDVFNAGADVVVVGSVVEENPKVLLKFSAVLNSKFNRQ